MSVSASPSGLAPPSQIAKWWLATRPKTLTAAAAPVLVGLAVAGATGPINWGAAIACLLGAWLLQVGSNFANDVYDHEKGADDAERLGPARAVSSGWISPAHMKRAMAVVFGLATLVGLYLTAVAGPAIVAIGVASIIAAIAYTGGPYPLGYNGLGDVFVLIFFGFVAVCGTAFAVTGSVPASAWVPAAAVGAMAANILVVNNLRDVVGDARVGKRTLVVRFGRSAALAQYGASVALAYATPSVLWFAFDYPVAVHFALLTLPLAVFVFHAVLSARSGTAYNNALAKTAAVLFAYALGLALAIGLST